MTDTLRIVHSGPDLEKPPSPGTGVQAPGVKDVNVWDGRAVDGRIWGCSLNPSIHDGAPGPGYVLGYVNACARQDDDSLATVRLDGNATLDMERFVRGRSKLWFQTVWYEARRLHLSAAPVSGFQIGDTITGTTSGATGVIESVDGRIMHVTAPTGRFETYEPLTVNGGDMLDGGGNAVTMSKLLGGSQPTDNDPGVPSEWSGVRKVSQSSGQPRLEFEMARDSVWVGAGNHVRCSLRGSDRLRPRHEAAFLAVQRGGAQPYAAYARAADSPFDTGADRMRARGDITTFVGHAAGTVEVDWTVLWWNAARQLQVTTGVMTFDATDPETQFTAAQTYEVDVTGIHARARAGAPQFTSLDAALTQADANGGPAWIKLESDQTHAITTGLPDTDDPFYLWGHAPSASRARIESGSGGGLNLPGLGDAAFRRFTFNGGGDVTNPAVPQGADGIKVLSKAYTSIVEVEIEDCGIGIYASEASKNILCVHDCTIERSWDYALLGDKAHRMALRGVSWAQASDVVWSGTGDNKFETDAPFITDHGGTARITALGPMGLCEVAGFALGSWAAGTQGPLRLIGHIEEQVPPVYAGQLSVEGPGIELGKGIDSSRTGSMDLVLDGAQYAALSTKSQAIRVLVGGVTIRNLLLTVPDRGNLQHVNGGLVRFVQLQDGKDDFPGNVWNRDPIVIESCTLADQRGATAMTGLTWQGIVVETGQTFPAGQATVRDLLVHLPNRTEADAGPIPGLDATPTWTPRYGGDRIISVPGGDFSARPIPEADWTYGAPSTPDDPSITALWQPQAGSPAIGAASDLGPVTDLAGKLRPNTGGAAGAMEP